MIRERMLQTLISQVLCLQLPTKLELQSLSNHHFIPRIPLGRRQESLIINLFASVLISDKTILKERIMMKLL
jgi:hypothetical protein